jgi:hypothetical protein
MNILGHHGHQSKEAPQEQIGHGKEHREEMVVELAHVLPHTNIEIPEHHDFIESEQTHNGDQKFDEHRCHAQQVGKWSKESSSHVHVELGHVEDYGHLVDKEGQRMNQSLMRGSLTLKPNYSQNEINPKNIKDQYTP